MLQQKKRVMTAVIVDDDPVALMLLREFLESLSITVHAAGTVAEAKSVLREVIPTVAILDVMLPDGDGTDIMLLMRGLSYRSAIALVTASLEVFPMHKCEGTPPDMLFAKPLDFTTVHAWVEKMAKLRGIALC
jgi:DNA-binding response OmpR family regulator